MAANGYLEQRPSSPTGFGLVLLLHGAAIAGVVMIKGPTWVVAPERPTITYQVPPERIPEPPPPPEPQLRPELPQVQQRVPLDAPVRQVPTPVPGPTSQPSTPPVTWSPTLGTAPVGSSTTTTVPVIPTPMPRAEPPRTPIRVAAQFDSRYAGAMQPPYPAAEQRAEREGSVRVRVTIGADGRVRAVQRLSATSDAFWRVTESQALSRWRFRPATEDGRPVESSKDLTVHFRLDS